MANDAGTAYVDVHPDLKGFGRELGRGIDPHVDKSAKNVESKFSGAFGKVAKVAGGIFAAKLGLDAVKGLIGGASDLNETLSKSNTIFGDQGKAIEAWAGTAAKSFGQTKQGALDAAATFGNLFVQLGTGSKEAAAMSKQMVELASDFASFHNADPTDVIESMTAAFRGEYDAVQRYVPTINAAAVEQKALKMGLAASTKELTAQDKALATQTLLMEGAGAAVGDFARTSDGLANRQRILSAQFQDMKDRIGTALLPVVLRLLEGFVKLGSTVGGPLKRGFETAKNAVSGLFDIFARRDFTGGFEGLAIEEDSPIIAGLFKFRDTAASVVSAVTQQFGNLVGWFKTVWPPISEAVGHVVAVIQALWRTFGDELVSIATMAWNQVRIIVETVIGLVRGIIETALALINGDWGRAWDGIKGILSTAWEFIKATVGNALGTVREIIEAALDVVRGAWERVWGGISSFFRSVWDGIIGIVRRGVAAVVDVFLGMVEAVLEGGARMFGWVPGIGGKLREARDAFAEFRDNVNRSLGGIQDKTIELFLKANDRNLGTAGDPIYANKGRLVPGVGDGDTVPAWLTPGEFVVRKEAVKALGVPYLERLNAQGYATGGLVDFQYHLPGVDGIRAAAQGAFDSMAEAVAARAQKKFQEQAEAAAARQASGGGDIGGGTHVGNTWEGITAALDRVGMDYTVTSAYRPGDPGFHGRGKAVDLVGDMAAIFHTIAGFSGINELFFDPIGWYLDEGRRHSGAIGDHGDHVHAATFHTGGIVQGPFGVDTTIVAQGGEGVFTREQMAAMGGLGMDDRTINRFAEAVAAALRAEPPVVRVPDINRAQTNQRRARSRS